MSLDLFLRHLSDPRPRFECEPAGSPQDIRTEVEISHRLRPPALVRELIDWTSRLRSHVPRHQRNHLFLMKPRWSPTAATRVKLHRALERFIAAHALKPFTFSSVRPSVLTALYRSSGDLRAVKEMANHASISTTVRYVQGPEVAAQNSLRMAALQSALLGHVETSADDRSSTPPAAPTVSSPPSGTAISIFGFTCKDPFSGLASGTRRGVCTNFLACLTCPNALEALN